MKTLHLLHAPLIAALLSITACAADTSDGHDDSDAAEADSAPALDQVTEATSCFAWPRTLQIKSKVLSSAFVTWNAHEQIFAQEHGMGNTMNYYYTSGPGPALEAVVPYTSCVANHAAAGTNGWVCDGVFVGCPFIDHSNNPDSVFYGANGCGYSPSVWYPGSSLNAHNTHGANGVWCISDGTPGATTPGVDQQGHAGAWQLNCSCPIPGGTVTMTNP